jgi:RNA polymerase sigma-70 factor (ECF subfamily)
MSALTLLEQPDTTLDRARGGDHDAFAELVARHENMVFSIALHFFADRARAEEIAQDVFLQLYRSVGEIASDDHLLFWLRQVTSRRCIDALRRARMKFVAIDAIGELPARHQASDPIRDRLLQKLVATLPEVQRVVVTLRYQEDLDPAEICRVVNLPVNTVKSHLHRAIQSLRKKLGDHR